MSLWGAFIRKAIKEPATQDIGLVGLDISDLSGFPKPFRASSSRSNPFSSCKFELYRLSQRNLCEQTVPSTLTVILIPELFHSLGSFFSTFNEAMIPF